MAHPVKLEIEPPTERNRLTVAFRPILAIPHVILVGGPVLGILGAGYRTGVLGTLAAVVAIFDWVAILVRGRPLEGLTDLKLYYLQWRARVLAYCALLRDEYPPFGDSHYPAKIQLPDPPMTRNRVSVGFRLILAVPHILVLLVLLLAWLVVAIVSWFAILINGQLAPELWRFGRDVMAYSLRVEAYLLLIHDQFPPFALSETDYAVTAPPEPQTQPTFSP